MPTQLPSVPSLIPSSFATLAIGRDVSITIFTASSLNSGEKLFFGRGKTFTFPDVHPIGWTVRKARGTSQANGRVAHRAMQWPSITGSYRFEHGANQPGVWDREPDEGSLPQELAPDLCSVLAGHTGTPGRCWFAVWEGWGCLAFGEDAAPAFEIPNRRLLVLTGPITAVCWRHPYLVTARRLPALLLGYDFSPSRGIHSWYDRPTLSSEAHGP